MSSRETETLDLRHVGEVAAVIAKNSETILGSVHCLASPSLQVFWEASRKRADLWQYALDDALDASRRDQPLGKHAVRSSSTVIGEVLATELVTRLWTAVIVGHEKRHQRQHEPLARRVFSDHLTARRSSLRLLTHPIALPSSQIVALDRIRQRAERWTDCLLATLPSDCGAAEFAFDRDRFDEFSEDTDVIARLSTRFSGWHLLSLSLRVASAEGPASDRTRNALHRAILDSIGAVIDAAETSWQPHSFGDDEGKVEASDDVGSDDVASDDAISRNDPETGDNPAGDDFLGATLSSNLIDRTDLNGVAVPPVEESESDLAAFAGADDILASTFGDEQVDASSAEEPSASLEPTPAAQPAIPMSPSTPGPEETASTRETPSPVRLAAFGHLGGLAENEPSERRTIAVTESGLEFRPLYEERR